MENETRFLVAFCDQNDFDAPLLLWENPFVVSKKGVFLKDSCGVEIENEEQAEEYGFVILPFCTDHSVYLEIKDSLQASQIKAFLQQIEMEARSLCNRFSREMDLEINRINCQLEITPILNSEGESDVAGGAEQYNISMQIFTNEDVCTACVTAGTFFVGLSSCISCLFANLHNNLQALLFDEHNLEQAEIAKRRSVAELEAIQTSTKKQNAILEKLRSGQVVSAKVQGVEIFMGVPYSPALPKI